MIRKSKIARLPRSIRDELNRRLDNGQPGIRLVEWLNSLPEAKEILVQNFQSRPITPQNISEWKRGGYQDWAAQQERVASLQDFLADAKELGDAANPEKLNEALFTFVTVHFAAAMQTWAYRPEERKNLDFWSRIVRDVVHLRQSDLAQQRLELDEQRMELRRQRLELDRHRLDLARQKANAAMNPKGVPFLSPGLRRIEGRYPGKPSSDIVPNPERVASRSAESLNTPTLLRDTPPGTPENPSKSSLPINHLQSNPVKSNLPFFIFSQITTVGQPSRLSPSSSTLTAAATLPKTSAILRLTPSDGRSFQTPADLVPNHAPCDTNSPCAH